MKPSKYKNKRTNGRASGQENARYCVLHLLEKAGKISNLREQVRYEIIPKQPGERAAHYVADFVYTNEQGETVVEDAKSDFTRKLPVYVLKRKLMLHVHGIKIAEVL